MTIQQPQLWAERADAAEAAIVTRHLRMLWWMPRTRLGVVAWPSVPAQRGFVFWNYWWQAHLIDCAVDAANRMPSQVRRKRVADIARGMRVRNITGWTNRYYDDMAWLTIALERAQRTQGIHSRNALRALGSALHNGFDPAIGAVPWRIGDDFYNAPANGPAGIALVRLGLTGQAVRIADWLDATLRDEQSGLIVDGIHLPGGEIERPIFTYCQGVALGLDTELAVRLGDSRFADRARRLLLAVEENMTVDGVIGGGGGGDGGLFNGILARYLAQVAMMLPGNSAEANSARRLAASIVLSSADAAWANRLDVDGEPLFGYDWCKPAQLPGTKGVVAAFTGGAVAGSAVPERDLSVQLGGWMLLEAAYLCTAAGF